MVKDNINIKTILFMKVFMPMIKEMALEEKNILMEKFLKELLIKIKNIEVVINFLMAVFLMD